jgi:hypothetical protein
MRTVLAALLMFVATTAVARADDAKKMATDDCARARAANKTCVIDMGNEKIEGETPTNSGMKVDVIKFITASSLIHIRKDFIPEIIKTAEDL